MSKQATVDDNPAGLVRWIKGDLIGLTNTNDNKNKDRYNAE